MCHSDNYEDALEQRYATLDTRQPACSCGETHPFALTGAYPDIVCYECQNVAAGRPRVEQQHVQGQHNGPQTVPMLGNDHRIADSFKIDWPVETLRNPNGSPLLKAAAIVRGVQDLLRAVIHITAWVPALLEAVNKWLVDEHGQRWWHDLSLGPVTT